MSTDYTTLAEAIKQAASALPPDKQAYFLGYITAIADMAEQQRSEQAS